MLEDIREHKVPGPLGRAPRSSDLAVVVSAMICLMALASCALPVRPSQNVEGTLPVRFVYVDTKAREVCLAGSFNDWSVRSHCLTRTGDRWTVEVLLPPGRYQYAFLVDGATWREDPGAVLSEDTGFGTRSSILIID